MYQVIYTASRVVWVEDLTGQPATTVDTENKTIVRSGSKTMLPTNESITVVETADIEATKASLEGQGIDCGRIDEFQQNDSWLFTDKQYRVRITVTALLGEFADLITPLYQSVESKYYRTINFDKLFEIYLGYILPDDLARLEASQNATVESYSV